MTAPQHTKITIERKLTLIIVLVSSVSLLLAASLFTFFQLSEYRQAMVESLKSTANITAENVQAAIWFDDKRDANHLLAELENDPRILTAAIYTKDKQLFAIYDTTQENYTQFYDFRDQEDYYVFDSKFLHLYQPITLQSEHTIGGYIYLKATLNPIQKQLNQNIFITMLIVGSILVAILPLTSRLQKVVSNPILQLLQATKAVKDDKNYSIRVSSTDFLEAQQLCDGFNSMLEEIQSRDEHLQHLALYDELTGIPNRSLFVDHFQTAIAHTRRAGTQLAICFLDIDNFKPINDKFGHEIGDKLLIDVGKRITDSIRKQDTVSRQGGDEFAILLNDIDSDEQLAQSIKRIHSTITQPYLIDGFKHNITVSTGITLFPDDDGDIDTLIRHADQAMYSAKLAGKNRYHLFNPQLDQQIIQKNHLFDEIEEALNNNEFTLHYQPKVDMATGEVFGAEALIRWQHPQKGLIPPIGFLPAIEGSQLESEIGRWVINQALAQLDAWKTMGIAMEVSVNISSSHLQSSTFIDLLSKALKKHSAVPPKALQLEILESSVLGDIRVISDIINACQRLGVSIALDDFGTGYSSLTHIRRLPVNIIKIDQSFVRDIMDDPSDYTIVTGVIGLADSFNKRIIAEGVESTEHGLALILSGCSQAQGYCIAKPMPAEDIPNWLKQYRPNQQWIKCASKRRTLQASKAELFSLFTQHWISKLEAFIQSPMEQHTNTLTIHFEHSHFNHWIKRAQHEYVLNNDALQQINKLYSKITTTTAKLFKQHQSGKTRAAQNCIKTIQSALAEVCTLLRQSQR